MKVFFKGLILFYKRYISSSVHARCRYTPTCSMYTLDAIEKYGAIKGSILGARRILRCNHFAKGGFDPVKENLRGSAKWTL